MSRPKLPEITYPLTVDTIGKDLAMGNTVHVECANDGCRHRGWLDLEAIAEMKGVNYPNGRESLLQVVYCPECRAAGDDRRDKNLIFTVHAPSDVPRNRR